MLRIDAFHSSDIIIWWSWFEEFIQFLSFLSPTKKKKTLLLLWITLLLLDGDEIIQQDDWELVRIVQKCDSCDFRYDQSESFHTYA